MILCGWKTRPLEMWQKKSVGLFPFLHYLCVRYMLVFLLDDCALYQPWNGTGDMISPYLSLYSPESVHARVLDFLMLYLSNALCPVVHQHGGVLPSLCVVLSLHHGHSDGGRGCRRSVGALLHPHLANQDQSTWVKLMTHQQVHVSSALAFLLLLPGGLQVVSDGSTSVN